MNEDLKNMFLAMTLCMLVLLGWQYFYAGPQLEAQRLARQNAQTTGETVSDTPVTGSPVLPGRTASDGARDAITGVPAHTTGSTDNAGLSAAPDQRIEIDNAKIAGSINLTGARIDDVRLRDYHESVDPESPIIALLTPAQSPGEAFFAYFGWAARQNAAQQELPGPDTEWAVESGRRLTPGTPLVLRWENSHGSVFRIIFSIDDAYMFSINQSVENRSDAELELFPYGAIARRGAPQISGFFILHEGLIGVFGDEGLQEVDYDDVVDEGSLTYEPVRGGWIGITDKYWGATFLPETDSEFRPGFSYNPDTDIYQADFLGSAVSIAPGVAADSSMRFFSGAKQVHLIADYERTTGALNFDLLIDWGWFYFLTRPTFLLIDLLFDIVGNFGVAILLVTVIIKAVFFPLANKSYVSMSKLKLIQPQMLEIRDKYKDDKAKQQQALMEVYKKEKINPLAGCLPILLQIPVFFALYKVLFVTIEMRHAPFFGWVRDLSAPDPTTLFNLFGLIPWQPPALLMLGVWPIAMGLTMFVQMKMNPTPTDPTQAMIFNWMPWVFMVMLASFPAGLVIYWAWNNLLSIIQQYVIMRRQGVKIELWDNLAAFFRRKRHASD